MKSVSTSLAGVTADRNASMLARFITFFSNFIELLTDLFPRSGTDTPNHHFARSEISSFHYLKGSVKNASGVDDQTWRDLDMDAYTDLVSANVSIFGRQMLYRRLRSGLSEAAIEPVMSRVAALLQNAEVLNRLDKLCAPLRRAETEVGSLFAAHPEHGEPKWASRLWLLQLALVGSVCALWLSPYAIIPTIAAVIIAVTLQVTYHGEVTIWTAKAKSLQQMLAVASEIAAFAEHDRNAVSAAFAPLPFRPLQINRALACSSFAASLPGVGEYFDWFLADNIRKYYVSLRSFNTHFEALEDCFHRVSDLEADIAIARHLTQQGRYCWAIRTTERTIDLDHAVHPLLAAPMPVSVCLSKESAFVSGKNGIGKSTFLRTVGVNLLAARAFGFCYARHAWVSVLPLYSSMRNEDSMDGGESLYTSELMRAKDLLDACSADGGAICLIDEIFRGTNHVESVSAAASVLYEMSRNALVIVSSHNLVLAPLLDEWFRPLCLEREKDGASICVIDGLLVEPNGIRLLAAYGFGSAVQGRAQLISQWFNSYLAKPTGYPDLLDT